MRRAKNKCISKRPLIRTGSVSYTHLGVFHEKVGCIEIGNNVFIGTGSIILYDTKIGSNVIVAAGSIITKDVPDNVVVAGIPAKVIGTFDTFLDKRIQETYLQYVDAVSYTHLPIYWLGGIMDITIVNVLSIIPPNQ